MEWLERPVRCVTEEGNRSRWVSRGSVCSEWLVCARGGGAVERGPWENADQAVVAASPASTAGRYRPASTIVAITITLLIFNNEADGRRCLRQMGLTRRPFYNLRMSSMLKEFFNTLLKLWQTFRIFPFKEFFQHILKVVVWDPPYVPLLRKTSTYP